MGTPLPFHVPDVGEEEIQAVSGVIRSGWLTTGPTTKRFEQEFAAQIGVNHAIALNSCTAALHLALEAVGVREGDEVIVPTMTFAATGEVVTYLKAKPVLVDVSADTLNIDLERIEAAITPRTRAVMPVHFAGHPCEMDALLRLAEQHDLRVVEDAAHALPARYRGQPIGTIGDCTCFSFYATKSITTGEGGMLTTKNDEWAGRIRMMSLHGLSRDAWKRYSSEGSWRYDIHEPGFKYNLTDLAAAIGLTQLQKSERFWKTRERYAWLYNDAFHDIPELTVPTSADHVQHGWHLYVLRLNLERLHITRNAFIDELRQEGIGCSVHFIPLHLHPYYRRVWGYEPADFPIATAAFESVVSLPLYPKMSEADVQRVADVVRDVIKRFRR